MAHSDSHKEHDHAHEHEDHDDEADHDHDEDGHDHEHDHHHHGLGHAHAPASFSTAFAVGTCLNAAFVVAEATFGFWSHSLALLSDAGHNLGDVIGLLMAWGASALSKTAPTTRHTYGLRSTSILAALLNAIILLLTTGGIAWEAVQRFSEPAAVNGKIVIIIAAIGIVVNGATALMFMSGRKGDLNVRGAFLHMAGDAAIALGVVISGFIILGTGLHWIDPVTSLAISAIIVWGTWALLRDSFTLALQGVPPGIDLRQVKSYLESLPGIAEVHDLHIWGMSTTETALTAHLVREDSAGDDALLARAADELQTRFKIGHATIQLEHPTHHCELSPADRV